MSGAFVDLGIVYATVPGFRPLCLDLYRPEGPPAAVCVYLHGGGWRMGSRRAGPGPLGPTSHRLFLRMAEAGIAVASADYRLSGEATWPAQADDVLAACRFIDSSRAEWALGEAPLVLFGVSAGGQLAALRAFDGQEPRAQALACWYPVTEFLALPDDISAVGADLDDARQSREALLLGDDPAAVPDRARAASPVCQVTPGVPPVLLLHGDTDVNVPLRQSERLAAALSGVDAAVALDVVAGYPHMFTGMPDADVDALVDRTVAWLLNQVQAG